MARQLKLSFMALIALGLLPQVPARGEENMQPDKLLPANILGWSAAGPDRVFDRKTLFDYMNGAGEVYLAYDFRCLTVREYTKPSAPRIVAEIYAMGSPEDAYGIFSHDQDGKPASVGQEGIYAAGLLRFWKDGLFIRLLAEQETEAVRVAVMALGRRIAEGISQEGRKPRLLACLPVRGLLKRSVRYFHTQVSLNIHYYLADSNVLNLGPRTNVVLARYQRAGRKVWLVICQYPHAKQAATAFQQFSRVCPKSASTSDSEIKQLAPGEFAGARRSGRFVILVFEAASRNTCEELAGTVLSRIREVIR